jgi:hypothetical protein
VARFDERATTPGRGPGDILRWKLGKKEPRPDDFAALDAFRLTVRDGGAEALAATAPVAVWIGHATWALRLAGKLIVTDPIWSRSIGGAVRRLVPPGVALDSMPAIDVVLVTHDHRDHLDLPTIRALPHDALYVVPLGNGPRLGKPNVIELDWWQTHQVGELAITLVPARHWSMRMPWNRNATLWGGYVIRGPRVGPIIRATPRGATTSPRSARRPGRSTGRCSRSAATHPAGSWSRSTSTRAKPAARSRRSVRSTCSRCTGARSS